MADSMTAVPIRAAKRLNDADAVHALKGRVRNDDEIVLVQREVSRCGPRGEHADDDELIVADAHRLADRIDP